MQVLHPIHSEWQSRRLIQLYYSFNQTVAKRLLGVRLEDQKSSDRLAAIGRETNVLPWSCSRQFSNFGRMLHKLREIHVRTEQPMPDTIAQAYQLPTSLANSYAMVLFACEHRMEFCRDRNLDKIDFVTACKLLAAVSVDWGRPNSGLRMDEHFMGSLNGAREAIERQLYDTAVAERFTFENANRQAVIGLADWPDARRRKEFVEGCFKPVLTGVLAIAAKLELSRLMQELVEKVVIPLQKVNASSDEMAGLFKYMSQLAAKQHLQAWSRYLGTIRRMAELVLHLDFKESILG